MRALSIGASTVLISVWPVLKSLPQIGTLVLGRVAARSAGMSTVRFGAPLANGTPSSSAA